MYPFIAASHNSQCVKANEMTCKVCDVLSYIKDNDTYNIVVTDAVLSAEVTNETNTLSLRLNCYNIKI